MRVMVTEPYQKPYYCTATIGCVRLMLDNGWTVQTTSEMSREETSAFGDALEHAHRVPMSAGVLSGMGV